MNDDFVVGLDVGTTRISVLIGEVLRGEKVRVIGASAWPTEGIRKGAVVDIEKATSSIRSAVDEAERMAGVEISGVCAGISGPHIQSYKSCFFSAGHIKGCTYRRGKGDGLRSR